MVRGAVIVGALLVFAAPAGAAGPSSPDPSWGAGGLALLSAPVAVQDAASTPDGGVLAASENFEAVKLTADGALDQRFGLNGVATASVPVRQAFFRSTSVMVQDDGRIVLGGMDDPVWNGVSVPHFALARLMPDGTPDTSFGSGGMVVVTIAPGERDSEVEALARAPGGAILACGSVDGLQGPGSLVLARFDADGRLDPGFGTAGTVRGPTGLCDGMARGPGGTVVVGGSLEYGAQVPTFLAARYLANGAPDRSFGHGGFVSTTVALESACGHIHVLPQADGKVVLTGERDGELELLRLDATGRPDPTFGTGGLVTTRTSHPLFCGPAALQADGKIVVGATESLPSSDRRFALARYLPDGSPDPSFDGGLVFSSFGSSDYVDVGGLVLQPDGGIVALGMVGATDNNLYLGAWRLLGDGVAGAPADPDRLGWIPPAATPDPPADDAGTPSPTVAPVPSTAGATGDTAGRRVEKQRPDRLGVPGGGESGSLPAGAAPALRSPRARVHSTLSSLRGLLGRHEARRALRRGGLTVRVVLGSGDRLAVSLASLRSPRVMMARGAATADARRAQLRLRPTAAGLRQLETGRSLALRIRVRIVSASGAAYAASGKLTLARARR